MIKITVEILPKGDEKKKFVHSIARIWNTVKTTIKTKGKYGEYEAAFMQSHQFNPEKVFRKGYCKNIHRTKRGVWDILFCCLYNAGFYERNKKALKKNDTC